MYLEQHDDNDTLIPLAQHPRLRVHWVARRDEKSLAAAIESRDWSDWYAWATPEATTLKHVRTRLRDEFGFPKSEIHAQAYWSAGRAMGTRRGDEPDATDSVAPSDMSPKSVAKQHDSAQQASDETPAPASRGSWRAQAAGRLLAPLRSALIVSGVLQAVITLVQLAPFVLLVELARLLVSGADASRFWRCRNRGRGAAGSGYGARCRSDAMAARRRRAVRQRLAFAVVGQVVAVAAGLVHRARVGLDQAAGAGRHAVIALSGHPCHPGRGRRGRRAGGGAGLSVRRRLAGGAGVVRARPGLPGVDVVDHDSVRPAHPAIAAVGRDR